MPGAGHCPSPHSAGPRLPGARRGAVKGSPPKRAAGSSSIWGDEGGELQVITIPKARSDGVKSETGFTILPKQSGYEI